MKEYNNIALRNITLDISTIENEVGSLIGLNIKFKENGMDNIYMTSDGRIVKSFPRSISSSGINLDLNSIVELNALLLNGISTYLFNIRKDINRGEIDSYIKSTLDDDLSLRINVSRHFFREKTAGQVKMSMSFIENTIFGEDESVMLQFTKKDIQVIHAVLIEIISKYHRCKSLITSGDKLNYETLEMEKDLYTSITKVDSSIVIDNIWLHGQELSNLLYIVDKLVYGFNVEEDLDSLNMSFRQMYINHSNGVAYLNLRKMTRDHIVVHDKLIDSIETTDDSSNQNNPMLFDIRIPLTYQSLSIFDLFLSIDILRHADIENETDSKIEIEGKQSAFASGLGVRYHISTKESTLGFAYIEKYNKKNQKVNVLSLLGKVKENAFQYENEDGFVLNNTFMKDDKYHDVLTEFNIDMTGHWLKLIGALSIAYTRSYIKPGNPEEGIEPVSHSMTRFSVVNIGRDGKFRYDFSILSNVQNKAAAVLNIVKVKVKGGEEEIISSYRQPLFDRYVFQMLVMILSLSSLIEDISFCEEKNKKDIVKYKYKSLVKFTQINKNENIMYGLKKVSGIAYWGIHSSNSNMYSELTEQDQFMLNRSAYFRLFRGFWLPFVGLNVAIGQDKYLTDMFSELDLGDDTSPYNGLTWASRIFMGTMDNRL